MKLNWGHKLTFVIIAFIVGMLSMLYIASIQTNEMVEDNYYDREMVYQKVITASNNLNAVSTQNIIIQNKDSVLIKLPNTTFDKLSDGSIEFIRLSDQTKDKEIKLQPNLVGEQVIAKNLFSKGKYTVRVKWQNGIDYYKEENIFIN